MSSPGPFSATEIVLGQVADERWRQHNKWGEQNHPDGTGRTGDAEMADLYRANCKANGPGAWAEAIDRRPPANGTASWG